MSYSNNLLTLAKWMAGEFSNQAQASAEPVWYVNLRLWQRPIPATSLGALGGVFLFAEQASGLNPENIYRQRLIQLSEVNGALRANYYAFKQPQDWIGAGQNPELLSKLKIEHIEALPGCTLGISIAQIAGQIRSFAAELLPGSKCCFRYQGETKQVMLGFEAAADYFKSFDRGINPDTGAAIWGAIMGPYHLIKQQDYGSEIAEINQAASF
ncbi:protein of unknown function DUF1001 [Thalassoporum mexicanum PCC 7367]|uniref:chromophore lyase CpcT/CpeT n=1 Tax=Thalassoporum mexicanum TaxID=3457544 RepID=UPI00029F81E2|nr:chromophore lyase CpcT/CpeT [Pseudanabaena sp. PCC 7367]AFY68720.1 protein of unknown function DUF1001 [Pseudanabaena sp. PCC 7367]